MKKPIEIDLYIRIRAILESARTTIARSVNTTQVIANWLVGREIVEEEQHKEIRAEYGASVLFDISQKLQKEFGSGYSIDNLELFRRFYTNYPDLISDAPRRKSAFSAQAGIDEIPGASIRKSGKGINTRSALSSIQHAPRGESWKPGRINPNLSWTHYRTLLKVKRIEVRHFYEIESDKNDMVVKYVLDKKQRQIFTSRYQFHLPTEEELRKELRREMEMLALPELTKKVRKPVRRSK
jgi:predicted nuclease of restriction endonuclease-like (RecB) superfamily